MSSTVSKEAILEVLAVELQEVKFLAQNGKDSDRKAAAALRVLKLEQEIEETKRAA